MPHLIFLGVGAIRPTVLGDHTSLLLRHGDANILLDAGPAVFMQLDRAGVHPTAISHIYFSHQHGDHTLGSPVFLFYHRPRVFFGAAQVLEAWQRLIDIAYPDVLTQVKNEVLLHPLPADHPHPCPGLPGVTARLALVHPSNVPAFALRLDLDPAPGNGLTRRFSLVYSGDTTPSAAVAELAGGADLLIHEATALEADIAELAGVHSSARAAGAIAQAARARCLALVHRSAGDRDLWRREAAQTYSGPILAPLAGDRLGLPDLDLVRG
jgi:ribonuclease BN (tRNA processing enzyme)